MINVIHSNSERIVCVRNEGLPDATCLKYADNIAMMTSEWEIGRALSEKLSTIPDPFGSSDSIQKYFAKPLRLVDNSEGGLPYVDLIPPSEEGASARDKKLMLETTYFNCDTLWTFITNTADRTIREKETWEVVLQVLFLLETLRRNGLKFTHYDLHVGNICVQRCEPRIVKSPFPDIPLEFVSSVFPGIYDYDVSYIEGVSPTHGYFIAKNRLDKGIVPCVYDPLFDAATIIGSAVFALYDRKMERPKYSPYNDDDFANIATQNLSVNEWMRTVGFCLHNRGFKPLGISKMPILDKKTFLALNGYYFPDVTKCDTKNELHSGSVAKFKDWCMAVTAAKKRSARVRVDASLRNIIDILAWFVIP
jgi:hypothetical protein